MEPATNDLRSRRRRIGYATSLTAIVVAVIAAIAFSTHGDASHPGSAAGARAGAAGATTSTPGKSGTTGANGTSGAEGTTGPQPSGASGSAGTVSPGGGQSTSSTSPSGSTPATGTPTAPTTPTARPVTPVTVAPSIQEAYDQAYANECTSIWSIAGPDGILVDADGSDQRELTLDDCTSGIDTTQAFYDSDVADALHDGNEDAYWNLDNLMDGMRLRNTAGDKIWTSPLASMKP